VQLVELMEFQLITLAKPLSIEVGWTTIARSGAAGGTTGGATGGSSPPPPPQPAATSISEASIADFKLRMTDKNSISNPRRMSAAQHIL
jgi:hypothetical protein